MIRLLCALGVGQRQLRGGFNGLGIFFAALLFGVVAIAASGSLSDAILTGLDQQGRVLLGGDVSVSLVHRPATPRERQFLTSYGRVSATTTMRAMAYHLPSGPRSARTLVELKAVDAAYPLYGKVGLSPHLPLAQALACTSSACGAVVEQTLLARLDLKTGDELRLGSQKFRVNAVLTNEPDRISDGFSLGPHILVSTAALSRTGLITLGSLVNYHYRVAFVSGKTVAGFRRAASRNFGSAGWLVRDRTDAAPGLKRFVKQITMFLTLVGLTVLAVGGVGASQAIAAFLQRKGTEIATLKSLGADSRQIFAIYFLQIMAIAGAAVLCGVALGAMLPFALDLGRLVPWSAKLSVYPGPLLLAAFFGFAAAASFAISPLAGTRAITPASLYRDLLTPARRTGRFAYLLAAGTCAAAVIAVALLLAPERNFALSYLAGIAAGLVGLRLCAEALKWTLRALPRFRRPLLRLAFANLTRPGAATTGVIVALGLGLTLLATVSLLNQTLQHQVVDSLPATAPSFFFIDIQPNEAKAFDATIHAFKNARDYKRTPMIRGRITALNGVPAAHAKVAPQARWVLSGDRGITYAAAEPKGTILTAGRWWPADYQGPLRISFDAALAKEMHLRLGDTLTVNVLGRELTGTIASFRKVNFANGQQNFVLILSPGIINHAPHDYLATVRVPARDEEALYRAVTNRFANVSTVRVRQVIATIDNLLQELAQGVGAASLLTILSGLLVLAGAIAANQRARLYDATVLKVLGATRRQIAAVYLLEYGLLGVLTGTLALAAGWAAAAQIAHHILHLPFQFDLGVAIFTVAGGGVVTLIFGLVAALAALRAKPATLLRLP